MAYLIINTREKRKTMLVKEFTRLDGNAGFKGQKIHIVMDNVCAFGPFVFDDKGKMKTDTDKTVLTLANGLTMLVDAKLSSIEQTFKSYRSH